eukprot:TRINITY_DN3349_c0_g1_i1.p1 TRINITY_DN3349_c0_g1~~TRINITY_DN3349_c0_g1_i1.p1  ORF type:complete len:398 (+),score=93.00 TRINITY_DN3349_c0_g1_i1:179-1195(+)
MPPKRGGKKKPPATDHEALPTYDAEQGLRGWLRTVLRQLSHSLDRDAEEHIFTPNPDGLPRYNERIPHPMWFEKIQDRSKSLYTSIDELDWDVQLMCENCLTYNGAGTKWAGFADALLMEATAQLSRVKAAFAQLEAEHPEEAAELSAAAAPRLEQHPLYDKLHQPAAQPAQPPAETSPPREDRASKPPAVHPALRAHLLAEARDPPAEVAKRDHSVDAVLAMFQSALRRRGYASEDEMQSYVKFTSEMRDFINASPGELMYPQERTAHTRLAEGQEVKPSAMYGADLLVRLAVKFPELLPPSTPDTTRTAVYLAAEELMVFIALNWKLLSRKPDSSV